MSGQDWTPGSWQAMFDAHGGYDCMTDAWRIVARSRQEIAALDLGSYGATARTDATEAGKTIAASNARLIAAAPDYWHAAEQMETDASELEGDDAGYVAVPKDAYDALMAAHRRAKADGR